MKQNIIRQNAGPITIGIDLGDNAADDIVKEGKLATTRPAMAQTFGAMKRCRIAIEVGGHSPWVSRCLRQ